ncbi:MAG: hypothetical protein RI926_1316 [Actinomycetota bacterium]|jgi:hypothetical protein
MNKLKSHTKALILFTQIVIVLFVLLAFLSVIVAQVSSTNNISSGSTNSVNDSQNGIPALITTKTPTPTTEANSPVGEENPLSNSDGNSSGGRSVCDPVRDQLMLNWRQLLSVQEEKIRIQNQVSAQPVSPDPNRAPTDSEYAAHQAAMDQANADLDAAMAAQNAARIALDLKPGDVFCVGMW